MYLAKNRGGLCKNYKIHILQKIYKHYLDCNSSAPHGMKTKIFKNHQKSYEKLYWNLYRIIIFVRFLKIFVRGKGEALSIYENLIVNFLVQCGDKFLMSVGVPLWGRNRSNLYKSNKYFDRFG